MAEIASFGVDVDKNTKLAQNAQDTANTNATGIKNINDPNYLTPFEKPQLEIQMDNFAAIYKTDKDIAEAEGIDFTAYDAAYQAYLAYMKPLVADMTTYSPINRDTYNSMVTAVQAQQKAFDSATKAQYDTAINQAKTDIANGQAQYQTMQTDVANMKSDAANVATTASQAIASAGFANDTANAASSNANLANQAAQSAISTAGDAMAGVATAKSDAANALTSAATALNAANGAKDSAGVALDNAKSALDKVNSTGNGRNLWAVSQSDFGYFSLSSQSLVTTQSGDFNKYRKDMIATNGAKYISVRHTGDIPSNLVSTALGRIIAFDKDQKFISAILQPTADADYFAVGEIPENTVYVLLHIVWGDSGETMIQFGNQETDWTPAPEDVQVQISDINGELQKKVSQDTYGALAGTVDQVSTLSKQNQSELATKADSQTVDTLKQRVTTAENTLTQTATKTELEQTKTDVDKLNNSVNANASNITAQAGKIDGLLTSSTDINGKLTTLQGNFDLSSEQLSTTMSKVDSNIADFNNLTISNRNLALGTATAFTMTGNGAGSQGQASYVFSKVIPQGTVVTIAFDVSSSTGVGTFISQFTGWDPGSSWQYMVNGDLVKGTKHASVTLTTEANQSHVYFRIDNATGDVAFSNFIISESSKEVAWTPAPEDLATATALTQVKQTADSVEALATNNNGDITKLQVTATGLTADISKTNSTVSGLQTNYANLQALATGIQTTVGNNYNDLKSQVSQTNSAWQVALSNSGQTNLIYNSEFSNNIEGWAGSAEYYYTGIYWDGSICVGGLAINSTTTGFKSELSKRIPINAATAFVSASLQILMDGANVTAGAGFTVEFYTDLTSARLPGYKDAWASQSKTNVSQLVTANAVPVPSGANYVSLVIQQNGTGHTLYQQPMLVKGPTVGTYNSDSASQADITALADDINLRVKKGDVVNQFNIDAGGALLSTSGNNTKIVFSSPNIVFDSANPVQIPNANIPGKLTGKTFEAGTITATTKINGTDIEAPLIHSPSGSFKLDGATGDIIGASIQSSDGAWGITANGKISGASVTSSLIDISGDGSGPNFDAGNVTPDTATGIYSRYKYTNPNVGFDVNGMGRKMYKNGYLVINGDTFLNRTIGDWSADGGGKYVYDTMYEANVIKMRAYNYTGSNVQTDDPSKTQGGISSRLDIQPSAITMGPNFSVGNPNILINYTGRIKGGLIAMNAAHSIGTTDGGDLYFMQMNKDATNVDGSSIPIHVKGIYTSNLGLNNGHTLSSADGGGIYVKDKYDGSGNMVDLHVKKLYESSLLSLKTDIKLIDPHEALTEVVKNDVMGYHFKNDKTTDPKSVSVILDDINPIPKYYTSDVFKSADGTGRNDGTIVGYLMLSIKDLNSRLQKLEGTN